MLFFSGNNDSFTDDTIPDSSLKNGKSTGISVTNISTYGDTMTASVTLDTVKIGPPTVTTGSVTNMSSTIVTLNGTVTTNGLLTTALF